MTQQLKPTDQTRRVFTALLILLGALGVQIVAMWAIGYLVLPVCDSPDGHNIWSEFLPSTVLLLLGLASVALTIFLGVRYLNRTGPVGDSDVSRVS